MEKKSLALSVIGLAIIAVGSAVVCAMGFPAGLLVILPGAIPHAARLCRWMRERR